MILMEPAFAEGAQDPEGCYLSILNLERYLCNGYADNFFLQEWTWRVVLLPVVRV